MKIRQKYINLNFHKNKLDHATLIELPLGGSMSRQSRTFPLHRNVSWWRIPIWRWLTGSNLSLIVISGSYVDNSSAIAICATMGDNVVPGTYTPLKYIMVLADYASLQSETKIYAFS